jgi:hypothetical protein
LGGVPPFSLALLKSSLHGSPVLENAMAAT